MRLIDADRLKSVIKINMVNNEIKAMFNQYVDCQPTVNGWHDLRENPEDLPKDSKDYLIHLHHGGSMKGILRDEYWVGKHISEKEWLIEGFSCFTDDVIEVVAWKEIE